METYVVGDYKPSEQEKHSRIEQLADRLSTLGYQFAKQDGRNFFAFRKLGRLESVITELVPICERLGLDVEEFDLREYRVNDHSQRAAYRDGRIVRDLEPVEADCRQG